MLPLLLKQFVRDAHLDVVGLPREDQQGLVLRLPSKSGDRYGEIGMAADAELLLGGGVGGLVGQEHPVGYLVDETCAEDRRRNPEDQVVVARCGVEVGLGERAASGAGAPGESGRIVHPPIPGAVRVELVTDTGRMSLGAQQRDVRGVERHVAVDDAALHRGPGRLLVLLGDVDAFGALDDHLVALGEHERDLAALADVLPLDDLHVVTLLELHHKTSGAREMIRMNFLSRSSRPTGPKMRVPRGCCWSLMSTAAFSSKRM